jgi:hypothetical protein
MAARYVKADVHALYVVLELLEQFWREPSPEAAREVRLASQPFGLNPLDRRRLQWEIAESQEPGRRVVPAPTAVAKPAEDPRKVLQMVKR